MFDGWLKKSCDNLVLFWFCLLGFVCLFGFGLVFLSTVSEEEREGDTIQEEEGGDMGEEGGMEEGEGMGGVMGDLM